MNANIENFYEAKAAEQLEFENFIIAEAHRNELISIKRIEDRYESRLQARIEEAELRAEYETFSWNL